MPAAHSNEIAGRTLPFECHRALRPTTFARRPISTTARLFVSLRCCLNAMNHVKLRKPNGRFLVRIRHLNVREAVQANDASWPASA
jgi:hypothetical protein